LAAISRFAGEIPILGVCLGHQSLAQAFGARVVRARQVMHGKTSLIRHKGRGVQGAQQPAAGDPLSFSGGGAASLPDCFEVTAWSEHADGSLDEIMGLRHKTGAGGSAVPSGEHLERTGAPVAGQLFGRFLKKLRCLSQNRHEAKNFPETLFTLLPVQIISCQHP
jgi:hypothetical protein